MTKASVRIIEQHLLSDNWYVLKKIEFEQQRKDGTWQTQTREVYDRGNGATIGLYNLAKRTVILTRQFRLPAFVNDHDGYLIETAAGLLDNASPEERIRLEAEEETGYRVKSVRKVYEAFMSPGSVTERLHFFIGEYHPEDRISAGGGLAEEGEDIEVLELPFEQALAMIDDGRIMDGKTIILLQHLKLLMPPSRPLIILVAGPCPFHPGDDPAAMAVNLQAMQRCAQALLQAGHLPVVAQWLALPSEQLAGSREVGDEVYQAHFQEYAKMLLQRCDGVLRVEGPSEDADSIVELARQRGVAVYRDLNEIPAVHERQ
ncbi:ADP-ribose pyrophosphatase [Pseudomonas baltica]|uniref:ADP-ribose pyrophosphatase n=1 Tax=Pseudomonas baltica TaxID=2762576 RepID=UPI00289D13FF|nr:ADP-ribose pyrophosphatase [Pseudomonas baltica]